MGRVDKNGPQISHSSLRERPDTGVPTVSSSCPDMRESSSA